MTPFAQIIHLGDPVRNPYRPHGMGDRERRGPTNGFTLTTELAVELVIGFGPDEELVVPARVVAMTDRTVTVEVADGPLGLAIEMSPWCTVLVAGDETEGAVVARPGRRVGDVHSPTLLELVLEDAVPAPTVWRRLRAAFRRAHRGRRAGVRSARPVRPRA